MIPRKKVVRLRYTMKYIVETGKVILWSCYCLVDTRPGYKLFGSQPYQSADLYGNSVWNYGTCLNRHHYACVFSYSNFQFCVV